jgi:chemotaxis protein methyltransferase CheR
VPNPKDFLRRLPGMVRLWRWVGRTRHALVLRLARRRNYTFTQFCRLPTQVALLAGQVLDAVTGGDEARVIVFGCSNGAEAYSLASTLRTRGKRFTIDCYDIDAEILVRAREASYAPEEISRRGGLPPGFVERTFDLTGGRYVVKREIRSAVRFELGSVLDAELIARLEPAHLVLAQNFLYHLTRAESDRAFEHLIGLVQPRGALAVDGVDLDLRARCTLGAGLEPWPEEVERIHEEARDERGYAWPSIYWGLEPYDARRPDALRRYATIFLKPAGRAVRPSS